MNENDGEAVELWGFPTDDVDAVRALLEGTLGVTFTLHESASIGPYLFAAYCGEHGELTLRPNLDADFDEEVDDPEEALVEPDFPDFGVLLYADWRTASHECRRKLDTLGENAQLLLVE